VTLVAAGHGNDDAWDHEMLSHLAGALGTIGAVSIHRYSSGAAQFAGALTTDASPEHFYRLLGEVAVMEQKIVKARALLDYYAPPGRHLDLLLDEWGTWYGDTDAGLCQQNPLKDGLFTAAALNMFNRHCTGLAMTNMAQTANVLQSVLLTRGSELVLTPTYHAYEMLKGHQGATLLASRATSTDLADTEGRAYEALSLSASRSADGKTLTLSVVNLSLDEDCAIEILLRGLESIGSATARLLTAESPTTVNDFDDRERVTPQPVPVSAALPSFTHAFPAKSLTVIEITL
jgi:alpha-L-arabinofuranosidase